MKKILRFVIDNFFKLMCSNYIIFIFFGICFFPIILLTNGISGAIECYFENKDLSYSQYKNIKENFNNIRKMHKK